jgi:4-amino-4-deoxy-L-arabinose transferase-like glycosyltransferase
LVTEGYNPDKQYPHFLHPLVIAGAMRLFGEQDIAVALASALPTVLAAVFLFLLGCAWFDMRAGLVAALAFALGADTLYYGLSGLTEPLFTVLLMLSVFCFAQGLRRGMRTPVAWIAASGAILGLGQAVRPVGALYFAPYLIVLLAVRDRRWANVATFAAAFALLFSLTTWVGAGRFLPVGDPSYGLLTGIGEFKQKYDFHRMLVLPPNPWAYALSHWADFSGKMLASAHHYVREFLPVLGSGSAVIGALFVASWLVRYQEPALGKARALVLLLMAAQLGVNLLLWPTDRYFFPFLPLVILFASDYIWRIVDSLRAAAQGAEPIGR